MAGDWIKIETDTCDKPEISKAARILKLDRDAVLGKLIRLWSWFDSNSVDGSVDGSASTDIDRICYHEGFSAACVIVGWLVVDDEAEKISIPNFDRHNGQTAKQRALKNRRQSKWRAAGDASVDGDVDAHVDGPASTNASTREEKSREDKKEDPYPLAAKRAPLAGIEKPILASLEKKSRSSSKPVSAPIPKREPSPKPEPKVSEDGLEFAHWFKGKLPDHVNPQPGYLIRWAECYDMMILLQGRTKDMIYDVCKYVWGNPFWGAKFLSPIMLTRRDGDEILRFDKMLSEMKAENRGSKPVVKPMRSSSDHEM